jgi:hypothetical protein
MASDWQSQDAPVVNALAGLGGALEQTGRNLQSQLGGAAHWLLAWQLMSCLRGCLAHTMLYLRVGERQHRVPLRAVAAAQQGPKLAAAVGMPSTAAGHMRSSAEGGTSLAALPSNCRSQDARTEGSSQAEGREVR